jgi:hypothetical protein
MMRKPSHHTFIRINMHPGAHAETAVCPRCTVCSLPNVVARSSPGELDLHSTAHSDCKPKVSNQNDPIQVTMTYTRTLPTVMA